MALTRTVSLSGCSLLLLIAGCLNSEEPVGFVAAPGTGSPLSGSTGTVEARLYRPNPQTPILQVPLQFLAVWDVSDTADEPGGSPRPSGFEYKAVEVDLATDTDAAITDKILHDDNLFGSGSDPAAWVRVGPEVRELSWVFFPYDEVAFAVRALDQGGEAEPDLERGRNWVAFVTLPIQPGPLLRVSSPLFGSFVFPSEGSEAEITVFPNVPIELEWSVDASFYGSYPGETNYALDVQDPDDHSHGSPEGIGGWIGWDLRNGLESPIEFTDEEAGREHVLYVRARDDLAFGETLATIRFDVVEVPFDRFALIVDDARFAGSYPSDEEHDAFVSEVVCERLFELGTVDHWAIFGNPERLTPEYPITFDELSHYPIVVWSLNLGISRNGLPLAQDALTQYVRAGGRLFVLGGRQSSNLLDDFRYPKQPGELGYEPGTFLWEAMRYRDEIVGIPTVAPRERQEASTMIGTKPLLRAFPALQIDREKWDPEEVVDGYYVGGTKEWEGILDSGTGVYPIEGWEPIYSPMTFNDSFCCGRIDAGFSSAVVAHRYAPPEGTGGSAYEGRSVVFNFQPYWFEEEGVRAAGREAVDWIVAGLR